MRRSLPLASALALALIATGAASQPRPMQPAPAAAGARSGIDTAGMDRNVQPGVDFYGYASGNWQRTTEIPADRSSVGAFLTASNATDQHLSEMMTALLSARNAPSSDAGKIANYYRAYLNTAAIDAAGMRPIQADLTRFNAIRTRTDLSRVLGGQMRADVDPLNATNFWTQNLFGLFVTQGLSTPNEVMPYMLQGGLGLPEREYYLSDDPHMQQIRTAYRAYIEALLTQAAVSEPAARAQRIYDLEMKIARAHATREQSEDFSRSATIWTRAEFASRAPGIDWNAYFTAAQLPRQQRFVAYHAGAITGLAALVGSEPIEAWRDWLIFHQINTNTSVLPTALDRLSFGFYGTTLSGTPQQRSRDKRALASTNGAFGDAIGRMYVQRYFPASARAEVQQMVTNIKNAFATRVRALDWMAPATRAEALRKVETLVVGVGYPDAWRDYSRVTISPTDPYANAEAAEQAEYRHQLAKIGRAPDHNEWWMTPQTINAVNLPVQNALNFPAAILQPPFFDPSADAAYNYGAVGAVIGHEISHSFDNNGALFDASGALRNWWTPQDFARFTEQGRALARQYDAYEPFPGLHVNGALTLGENIADLAGLQAAYDAYHASLGGREAPVIDGMTGDQRFFLAFAQTWRTKMREASMRARIATDGHAPGMYRALTVRNLPEWYRAFNVTPGQALYLAPEQRVKVW